MLSFSKDYDWKQWVKEVEEEVGEDEMTIKRKVNRKVNRNVSRVKYETSLSDVTSFMNLSVFSIPEENE